jgi:L-threonylcarbamoyladenylate synthase
MKTYLLEQDDLTDENLKKVAELMLNSKVVAFPTETVYGLGAHVFKDEAVKQIFVLKRRPENKPLIVHIGKIQDVEKVAIDIPIEFYILAKSFFPGPLTVILKKNPLISSYVSFDDTIAVRMPSSIPTLKLINFVNDPIVGTSANISSFKNPINAQDVKNTFLNKIDAIIDDGECLIKVPSTIIDLVNYPFKILRQGFISEDQILKALKK